MRPKPPKSSGANIAKAGRWREQETVHALAAQEPFIPMRYGRGRGKISWYDLIIFGLAAAIVYPDKILD